MVSHSAAFLVPGGRSSLFSLENDGKPGKVSYDSFFFFFRTDFFLKQNKTILYDPHGKARIVLG